MKNTTSEIVVSNESLTIGRLIRVLKSPTGNASQLTDIFNNDNVPQSNRQQLLETANYYISLTPATV